MGLTSETDSSRLLTTHFSPNMYPPMLQNDLLRLPPFTHAALDPEPAFHFDANTDADPAFYFDADPDPAS
jgi:hypothetical protein